MNRLAFACLGALALGSGGAAAQSLDSTASRAAFRDMFEEMVEIDSSPSTGSCTRVVEAVEKRLRSGGYGDGEITVVIPEGRPDDGNIVAVLKAEAPAGKGVLLLAHIDVVDARREDWERDPFTLVEENGFFYARGVADDKGMAAIFLDLMLRLKSEGFRPKRDVKMALTCGEETSSRVNGVDHILKNRRDLIDADFALNEGAGGLLSISGKPLALNVQAGEKIHQVFALEVVNPGGHSSRPIPDNAVYRTAAALQRVEAHRFPTEITPVTRGFFERIGPIVGGEVGRAMSRVGRDPGDAAAVEVLSQDPTYNAMMRTTCVATQWEAGHAPNALPQRSRATLSCRIMQGTTPEQVRARLEEVVADSTVKVEIVRRRDGSSPPELTEEVMGPVRRAAQKIWPGVRIAPTMAVGATDGRFLMSAGVPTYGMSGIFSVPGEANAHGLNEKVRVKSLFEGRRFLDSVVRDYAAAAPSPAR